MGSMISKGHLQTVDGYIQKGIDEEQNFYQVECQTINKKVFLQNLLYLMD
jgi:hypothetical protein